MCGICFILGGISIHNHDFSQFNFFKSYLKSTSSQHEQVLPLNEHILHHKLLLPYSVEPRKIRQKVQERGPDCFISSRLDMFKVLSRQLDI